MESFKCSAGSGPASSASCSVKYAEQGLHLIASGFNWQKIKVMQRPDWAHLSRAAILITGSSTGFVHAVPVPQVSCWIWSTMPHLWHELFPSNSCLSFPPSTLPSKHPICSPAPVITPHNYVSFHTKCVLSPAIFSSWYTFKIRLCTLLESDFTHFLPFFMHLWKYKKKKINREKCFDAAATEESRSHNGQA